MMKKLLTLLIIIYFTVVIGYLFKLLSDSLRTKPITIVQPITVMDSADRVLNLLEVILSVVALTLPLALGLVVYISQKSEKDIREILAAARTDQEKLAKQTQDAQAAAARSADIATTSKNEMLSLQQRFIETLAELRVAESNVKRLETDVQHALNRDTAMDKEVKDALERIETAETNVEGLKGKIQAAERNIDFAYSDVKDLNVMVKTTLTDIQASKQELERVHNQLNDMQRNLLVFEVLNQVNIKVVQLFSEKKMDRKIAVNWLIEFSKDDNPVIRRECALAFEHIPNVNGFKLPTADIIQRLQEMIEHDAEPAVCFQAQQTLQKLTLGKSSLPII